MVFEFFFSIFLIVCAAFAFVLALTWMKQRGTQAVGRKELAPLQRELSELRQRVQTLERIVTDSRYDLAKEIETLESPTRDLEAAGK